MCWYLAIFVWGVIINELRIVIITLMAPIRAQAIFDEEQAIRNSPYNPQVVAGAKDQTVVLEEDGSK